MRWRKIPEAARECAGGVNAKVLYQAIRAGKLKAARIGAGRNVLTCDEWIDEWLQNAATRSPARSFQSPAA